ncbi:MAG: nuclear transport factor 2 family protein, partial [Polyangiaceae bacterium]|nr:nuclear transport factor 2 family protein [Polyangiaceae bacterium]
MDLEKLHERVRRIEAIEDIKRLKARYWYACDHKDIEQVRDCFLDGPIEIDYAGSTGKVEHRDALREV